MGWKEVKKELLGSDKETLINHFSELYKKFDPVKDYFNLYTSLDEEELLNKYKKKLQKCFSYSGSFRLDNTGAKRIVEDFSKIGTSPEIIGSFYLYYVEECFEHIRSFSTLTQPIANSILNYYQKCLNCLYEDNALLKYKNTAEKIIDLCEEISYALYEAIDEVYYNYYLDFIEEDTDKESKPGKEED